MKVSKLIKDIAQIELKGNKNAEVSGLTSHSKTVSWGNLFVAKKNSHNYISEAIGAGASAILTDIFDPFISASIAQLITKDVAAMEAILASRIYDNPSQELLCIGVTGTAGKTTTTYILRHIFNHCQKKCGLMGTIEIDTGDHVYAASLTTADVVTNQKMLREMRRNGCVAAAMEVSSHGLHQGRTQGISFACAIYTNLSRDHLDYHSSMEEYAAAKALLFSGKEAAPLAVVNQDCPWKDAVCKNYKGRRITYSVEQAADYEGRDLHLSLQGSSMTVHFKGRSIVLSWPLVGKFNASNVLASFAAACELGLKPEAIQKALKDCQGPPGRLERVGEQVFVDYSHKPEALRLVHEALRPYCKGRIITVFGCGGDRDQGKRPLMGACVEQNADMAIVTNDNPRTEDPRKIAEAILAGFKNPKAVTVLLDRAEAISKAIELASCDDVVLICGKGHETYQEEQGMRAPFSDVEHALSCIQNREVRR